MAIIKGNSKDPGLSWAAFGMYTWLSRYSERTLTEIRAAAPNDFMGTLLAFDELAQRGMITDQQFGVTESDMIESEQPLKAPNPGFVYLLNGGGCYKIGRAREVDKRLTQIKPALPFPVTLMHSYPCADMILEENAWHQQFVSKRLNGEWFDLTDADVQLFMEHADG